jgi:hypothetical protein
MKDFKDAINSTLIPEQTMVKMLFLNYFQSNLLNTKCGDKERVHAIRYTYSMEQSPS